MKKTTHVHKERNTAQTMVELAVFGAVLFFVIGAMTINYIAAAAQQNAQFRSMRQALLMSYRASKDSEASRTSASFLVFEDRLTGEFGKYGTVDRQPMIAAGGGMMSAQSMQVSDWNDPESIPLADVTVNGEHFVFRTSVYASYIIAQKSDGVQIIQVSPDIPASSSVSTPTGQGMCAGSTEPCTVDPETGFDSCGSGGPCEMQYIVTTLTGDQLIAQSVQDCLRNPASTTPGPYVISCTRVVAEDDEQGKVKLAEQLERLYWEWTNLHKRGKPEMPPFFTGMVANDPEFKNIKGDFENTSIDKVAVAYNLTRKQPPVIFPSGKPVAWRWARGFAWEPLAGESEAERKENIKQKFIDEESPFLSYDIDGDLQEETLYNVFNVTSVFCTVPSDCKYAYKVNVQDPKLADVDPAKGPKDFSNPDHKPGIRSNLRIKGRTACVETTPVTCAPGDVTSLEVKEGKLYSDGKQVAVSVLKKQQYDVIEREYQLNIYMSDVQGFLDINNIEGRKVLDGCGGSNFKETCFDRDTKTLHIRSLLNDRRGHKWITDTDNRNWGQSLGGGK